MKKVSNLFAIPDDHEVGLSADASENYTQPVNTIRDIWPNLKDQVRTIWLFSTPPPPPPSPGFSAGGNEMLYSLLLTGKRIDIYGVNTSTHTVLDIMIAIQERERRPPHKQRLIYGGRQVEPYASLRRYNIKDESTLYMVPDLRGGWSWITHLRKQREKHGPLPRAEPLDPSSFIKHNFLCLHYKQRAILTSWNADFMVSMSQLPVTQS